MQVKYLLYVSTYSKDIFSNSELFILLQFFRDQTEQTDFVNTKVELENSETEKFQRNCNSSKQNIQSSLDKIKDDLGLSIQT
ncbi:unnamed protein product [Paramecium sonneborni]|uniref:Uncharacterized protein n=1 Tax=Paramecium sonneborni TaxID=65129 RepID=A0A8S1R8S0_9CILI|nr:unnamed protein product [Paramecium sonneborni]